MAPSGKKVSFAPERKQHRLDTQWPRTNGSTANALSTTNQQAQGENEDKAPPTTYTDIVLRELVRGLQAMQPYAVTAEDGTVEEIREEEMKRAENALEIIAQHQEELKAHLERMRAKSNEQ